MKQFLLSNNIIQETKHGLRVRRNISRFIKDDLKTTIISNTNFLLETASIPERIFCLYNDIMKLSRCDCGNLLEFQTFALGYKSYCCHECYANSLKDKPHWTTKRNADFKKAVFSKMSQTRRDRGGYKVSTQSKEKMSRSAKQSMHKKRETWKKKYGVENPGVLGGNSSKSARDYIEKFIIENNINKELCMFGDGKNKELWQNIKVPFSDKLRFALYDLVVFNDIQSKNAKNINNITLILEYNGPWHYRISDILNEHEKATPYRSNTMTKIESIQLDEAKREHMAHVSNYFVYWEKDKLLEKI